MVSFSVFLARAAVCMMNLCSCSCSNLMFLVDFSCSASLLSSSFVLACISTLPLSSSAVFVCTSCCSLSNFFHSVQAGWMLSGSVSPLASSASIGVRLLGGTVPGGQRRNSLRILIGSGSCSWVVAEVAFCVGLGVAGVGICAARKTSFARFCAAAIDLFASSVAILEASFAAAAQFAAFWAAAAAAASSSASLPRSLSCGSVSISALVSGLSPFLRCFPSGVSCGTCVSGFGPSGPEAVPCG